MRSSLLATLLTVAIAVGGTAVMITDASRHAPESGSDARVAVADAHASR